MTNSDNDRYFDFTEEDEVVACFKAASESELWKKVHSEVTQEALGRRNPIVGIKQLLAHINTLQAFQGRSIASLLSSIRTFLIIQIVLTTAVIVVLIVN